ncbi:hypothetical protein BN1002_03250 [Bacillus sp. B-jedd]|nr:hypothetical protein BN1002_03250 [Bacillus sp. B-jedd]
MMLGPFRHKLLQKVCSPANGSKKAAAWADGLNFLAYMEF